MPVAIDIERFAKEFVGITDEDSIDLSRIPRLDLCGRMGYTEYLDFIRPTDLAYPIMHGIDGYGRFFIAMTTQDSSDSQGKGTVLVVFQRYTGNERVWVNCGPFPDRLIHEEDWPKVKQHLVEAYQRLQSVTGDLSQASTKKYRIDDARPDAKGFVLLPERSQEQCQPTLRVYRL